MNEHEKKGLSRRDFTRLSAAAAAAGTFGILHAPKAKANSETLKVGLIGCGGRGSGAALQILQGNENVHLVGLADAFEHRLNDCKERFLNHQDPRIQAKAPIEEDRCFVGLDAYQKLLDTDIDIVMEATPPYARPKHLEAAVNAGKHIFAEKPMAVDPAGVRQVLAAVERHKAAGLSFVAGTQRRHSFNYQQTIEKIQNGELGDVIAMRAYWCGGLPFAHDREEGEKDLEYRLRNWYNQNWTCGDNIVEQHMHNIDVCNWVMGGPPKSVFASGGRAWKPEIEKYGDIWDHFSADFEYENGVRMFSMSRHWDGRDGGVFEEILCANGKSNAHDMGEGREPNHYVQELVHLVESIRGEGDYWHEGVQVCESTMTTIMARMSAYTGRRIEYDDALNTDLDIVPKDLDWDKEYPLGPIPNPLDD